MKYTHISLNWWQMLIIMLATAGVLYEVDRTAYSIYCTIAVLSGIYWYIKIQDAKEEYRQHQNTSEHPVDTSSSIDRVTIDKS